LQEIRRLHDEGAELYYSAAERNHLNLVRAAAWHFGTWRLAVEQAGLDYESLSRYRRWSRERVVERIRELHQQGADLSWRAVSTEVDPPLAAAALRSNGFVSWREAIAAAGLKIEETARYRYWDENLVLKEIKRLQRSGVPLSSKHMQDNNQSLFCAARRRFGSWDNALNAAGLDHTKIRLRRPKVAPDEEAARPSASRRPAKKASRITAERVTAEKALSNGSPPKKAAARKVKAGSAQAGAKKMTKPRQKAHA
jgi:hypothetical protein